MLDSNYLLLQKEIEKIVSDLKSNFDLSSDEATTKQVVVLRLLGSLGWNIFDASEVRPEYSVYGQRVDYALRISDVNKLFLEIKKPKEDLEPHQEQLLNYAFKQGVKLAVLTNGITWWFYLPLHEGSWERRRFYSIDIKQQENENIAEKFISFLSKTNVSSSNAIRKAETIYTSRIKEITIKEKIPLAWHEIISQPDELLVELISDKVKKLSGFLPNVDQVKSFLNQLKSKLIYLEHGEINKLDIKPKRKKTVKVRGIPSKLSGSECRFFYKNKEYTGKIINGKLIVNGMEYTSFSGASVAVTNTSRDGWDDWQLKLPGSGDWILAGEWRERNTKI